MELLSWLVGGNRVPPGVVDIASPAHKADPFPFYARLRGESPVHRVALRDGRTAWLVTRYDDAVAVLKDERFTKDARKGLTPDQYAREPWVPAFARPLSRNMLDLDPPDHTRLRALVQKAFTPRLVEELRPRIQSLADGLLDRLRRRTHFDLVRDYALPIPTTVIAEMLGVPAADMRRFHRWSTAVVTATASPWGMIRAIPSIWQFLRYARRLIRAKRAAPRDDLLTALVQAEEAGDKLSEDELAAMAFLLLVAGHETTVNLIANGTLALLRHPDQLGRLRAEPGLIKSGVEELLRYASPVETATERYAREAVAVAGVTLPRGALVLVALASANRDGRQFPDPDRLNVARTPNRHLSFGLGTHFCAGAPLARLEAQVAFSALFARTRGLRLAVHPEQVRWRGGLVLRGVASLPVVGEWA